jgi:hypothetical protein
MSIRKARLYQQTSALARDFDTVLKSGGGIRDSETILRDGARGED